MHNKCCNCVPPTSKDTPATSAARDDVIAGLNDERHQREIEAQQYATYQRLKSKYDANKD
jgi:hypothetical protein